MIRKHENAIAKKAAALSLLLHGGLLLMLVLSVNFKSNPPVSYSEVELWDTLPNIEPVKPKQAKIVEPIAKPVVVEPIIEKPILAIPPEIKIKEEIKKPKLVKLKPTVDPLKALQDEMASEHNKLQEITAKKTEKALNQARISTANQGEIDKYKALIAEKIKDKVNKDLCDIGNKKVTIKISMLITGEVSGAPRVINSSGAGACDQAIESAVLLAQPLPLPVDKQLFSQFRDLTLNFRPNE